MVKKIEQRPRSEWIMSLAESGFEVGDEVRATKVYGQRQTGLELVPSSIVSIPEKGLEIEVEFRYENGIPFKTESGTYMVDLVTPIPPDEVIKIRSFFPVWKLEKVNKE